MEECQRIFIFFDKRVSNIVVGLDVFLTVHHELTIYYLPSFVH